MLVFVLAALLATGTAATGPEGQTLTVSKAVGLSGGETVTVEGTGYDETKGIYVAFCVDNGPGAVPTPCGGGVDTTGSLGASHWISSNPPSYGDELAAPYDEGGAFSVTLTLTLTTQIGEVDCTEQACAVVTRADHTRGEDRSQDVRLPVTFDTTSSTRWWVVPAGLLLATVPLVILAVRILRYRRGRRVDQGYRKAVR